MSEFLHKSVKRTAINPMHTGASMLQPRRYPTALHVRAVCEHLHRWPLVADQQFILATRDTGYRNTSAAVAELIDNALQAGADQVHVLLREEWDDDRPRAASRRHVSIAVIDNGSGMSDTTLRTALQFGGSERFNDRTGSGRFGMGLPNSSVSQSRRLEVYSWRDHENPRFSYLDVREIADGSMQEVPAPVSRQLPDWISTAIGTSGHEVAGSGTLVLWPECDRLPYRRSSTVSAKLRDALGRIYRDAIRSEFRLFVDGQVVKPIDPLMEWGEVATQYGAATQYGDELCYEFRVPTAPSRTSVVRARFTVLPVSRWARLPLEVRRELGIVGGSGVSIVRAGREVDFGWHLMGAKRRENYDDWWRCEIRFEPELDEYFGVTHSKQGISPHPALQDALAADFEQIARTLNARVRGEFIRLATMHTARRDDKQEEIQAAPPIVENAAARVAHERERFLPSPLRRIRRFRIIHAPLTSPRFFIVTMGRGELVVTLNSDHPMYEVVSHADAEVREFFDTVLIAAARSELIVRSAGRVPPSAQQDTDALEKFLETWSDTLASYLSRRS